jgi:hypothetical protein
MLVPRLMFGLKVNANKTKYIVMSRDQNAVRSHNLKTQNTFFQRVQHFKYFGSSLTDQNSIQEEIKSRLNSELLLSFGAESYVFKFAREKYEV